MCAGHRHLGFDSAQSTLGVMERAYRNCLQAPGGESIHHPNETTSNGLASVPATLRDGTSTWRNAAAVDGIPLY